MTEAEHLGEKLVLHEARWERTTQLVLLCWWKPSPDQLAGSRKMLPLRFPSKPISNPQIQQLQLP